MPPNPVTVAARFRRQADTFSLGPTHRTPGYTDLPLQETGIEKKVNAVLDQLSQQVDKMQHRSETIYRAWLQDNMTVLVQEGVLTAQNLRDLDAAVLAQKQRNTWAMTQALRKVK